MAFFGLFGKKNKINETPEMDIDLDPPFSLDDDPLSNLEKSIKQAPQKSKQAKKAKATDVYSDTSLPDDEFEADLGYDPARRYADEENIKIAFVSIVDLIIGKTADEICQLWGDPTLDDRSTQTDIDFMAISGNLIWNALQLPWLANMKGCQRLEVEFDFGSEVMTGLVLSFKGQPWGDRMNCFINEDNELMDVSSYWEREVCEGAALKIAERTKQIEQEMAEEKHNARMRKMEEVAAKTLQVQQGILREAARPEYTYVCKHCGLQIRSKENLTSSTGQCGGKFGVHQWTQYK